MISADRKHSTIPSAIDHKLRSIRTWMLTTAVARTFVWGLTALLLTMIAAMIVDWAFVVFSTNVRVFLTAASLGTTLALTAYLGRRYCREAIDRIEAAQRVDLNLPAFEERWTTIATFPYENGHTLSPTSRAMLQQVTSEAVAMSELVDPRQVTRTGSLRVPAIACCSSILLLASFLALNWPQTSVLLRRFWSPTADITATQLASVTEDQLVSRGATIELTAAMTGLQRNSAELVVRYESGVTDTFDLRSAEGSRARFLHSLRVNESFRYQVLAGDGRTAWHTITAIDAPEFEIIRFRVTPPEYVNRPPYEKSWLPTRVKVAEGSRLQLEMLSREKLARMELSLTLHVKDQNDVERTIAIRPDEKGWYRFDTQLLEDMSVAPRLLSLQGLNNEVALSCRIEILPDMAPVARVITPNNEMTVAKDEVIDIEFEAHDDHGVATAELVIYDESERKDGEEPKILAVEKIDLGDQKNQKHVMGKTQLDLTKYEFKEGAQIGYTIRVSDNRKMAISEKDNNAEMIAGRDGEQESNDKPSEDRGSQTSPDELGPEDLAAMTAEQKAKTGANQMATGKKNGDDDEGKQTDATDSQVAADKSRSDTDPSDPKTADAANANTNKGRPEDNETTPAEKSAVAATGEMPPSEKGTQATDPAATAEVDPKDAKPSPPGDPMGAKPDSVESAAADPNQPLVAQKPGENPESSNSTTPSEKPSDGQSENVAANDSKSAENPNLPNESAKSGSPSEPQAPRDKKLMAQSSELGQQIETNRLKLKIVERLTSVATATKNDPPPSALRAKIEDLDRQLEAIQDHLLRLVKREVADSERSTVYKQLDTQLGTVETSIAAIRKETEEGEYAFVGLQMVDIGRTHVTPARDAIFAATQTPVGSDSNVTRSLHHVERARALLAALLKRYDDVSREREFKEALADGIKIYEVYIEKQLKLMREVRQNQNPLERKMAVLEIDQEYLDRYAEVLGLRREMLAEFGRMLGDDPRLMSRYLDLIKRRRSSLRDQLQELHDRQDEIASELSSWLAINEAQRDDLWRIVVDLRLQTAEDLANDAADFGERLEKQLPLVLEGAGGTSGALIAYAKQLAEISRAVALDSRELYERTPDSDWSTVNEHSAQLDALLLQIEATLDRLSFEHGNEAEVVVYVNSRLVECQTVKDRARDWSAVLQNVQQKKYHALGERDQENLTIATEQLRVQMQNLETDISAEFAQQGEDASMPAEISDLIAELQRVMEAITYTQFASQFALHRDRLTEAQMQHERTLAGFDRAEDLFDQIRRAVVTALDEYEVENPNIADLRDPTLDEFLAQLEREPDIEAQLGIPNRPRNLRVLADSMVWQESTGTALGNSLQAAEGREQMAMSRKTESAGKADPSEEEQEKPPEVAADPQEMKEMIEKSLQSIKEKMQDQTLTQAQREQLKETAENLKKMLSQANDPKSAEELWQKIVAADQTGATLQALARGERIPDQQWNRIISSLNEGLWQVTGRKPPEEYRKPIELYQDHVRELFDAGEND